MNTYCILFVLGSLLPSSPGDDCIALFVEYCVIMNLLCFGLLLWLGFFFLYQI